MWWRIFFVAIDGLSGHVQALVLTVQSKRRGPQTSRKIQTIQRQVGRGFAGVMALLWVFHAKHAWSQHAFLVMTRLQLSLSLDAKAVWVLTASAERIAPAGVFWFTSTPVSIQRDRCGKPWFMCIRPKYESRDCRKARHAFIFCLQL